MKTSIHETSQIQYRSDIDGLRAIAVLSVVGFHAFPTIINGGFIGVDVFFVISGFLISSILFQGLDKGTYSIVNFYARRIKRIFPALLIVLVCSYIFGWFALLSDEYKQLGKHISSGAIFASNLQLWSEAGYFDNSAETKPLLHLWSLGVEEQFYIIWPIILWLMWFRKNNLMATIICLVVTSFCLNLMIIQTDAIEAFYSPLTRFWELLCGSMVAWFMLRRKEKLTNIKQSFFQCIEKNNNKLKYAKIDAKRISNIASISGLMILVFGFWHITKDSRYPGVWATIPVLGAVLIILAGNEAWINRKVLSNNIAVWIGLVSYPLYLWHWPLLTFARIVEGKEPSFELRILAIALSFLLAWFTYKMVECPMRGEKRTTGKVTLLLIAMLIVGYVGFYTYKNDGLDFRTNIKEYVNNKNELARTPAMDSECLHYTGLNKPLFPYCRYTDANSIETVAVIGDSHAHVAYPGIADYLKNKGINTVLMANSSCPPFLGSYTGTSQVERDACRDRIHQILDVITKNQDIRKVFIFTRGPIYFTGTEPLTGNKNLDIGNLIQIAQIASSAQLTVNRLHGSGKQVYYVTENPELSFSASSCVARPLKLVPLNCSVDKTDVWKRQVDYIDAFSRLSNVTVINSLSVFCPDRSCIAFDDRGRLLYADDDHLSIAGSKFQVDKLLKQYLD